MELLFSIWGLSTFWTIVIIIIIGGLLLLLFIIAAFSYSEDDENGNGTKPEGVKAIPAQEKSGNEIQQLKSENTNLKKEVSELKEQLETQRIKTQRFEKLYSREKENTLEKENQYLKTQLSPHFLNNTLNNIYSLVLYDQESARESIGKLKRFLSYLLYETSDEDIVSLEQEMNYINDYIELYQIKLKDGIDIKKNYSVVNPAAKQIAPLILSPFIENAFKHGDIRSEDAFIDIEIIVDDNTLFYTVRNKIKNNNKEEKPGLGTKNFRRRLDVLYPNIYQYYTNVKDDIFTAKLILNIG